MNPARLLEHFHRISEVPDAVPSLRRFILDLAVRGRLVEQDPNDEPAAELLKRIQTEKSRLTKAGEIKKAERSLGIETDELPFGAPSGWQWERLSSISRRIHYGFTASSDPSITNVRLLRITDIQNNLVDWQSVPGCDISDREIEQYRLVPGDILVARTGGTIGKTFLVRQVPVTAVFASYLIRVQGCRELYDQYLKLFVESPVYWKQLQEGSRGTGQPNVNGRTLGQMIVSIPPIAEQHRIVAKVDELMALCDRLEAAQSDREYRRDLLVASSLDGLNQVEDDGAFETNASFHLAHLAQVTNRPDQISPLRETILNLAVLGRLVRQNPHEESASILMDRIRAEQAKIAGRGVKAPRATASNASADGDGPSGWIPVQLSDLCNIVTSGSRGWAEFYSKVGPKFLRAQNIKFGRLRLGDLACVSPPAGSEGIRTQISIGDLVVVITGAGVTNPALLERDLGEAYVSQHVGLIRPTLKSLSRWLLLCLMAPAAGRAQLVERAYGAGKPGLNLENIRTLSIPLPPLAEQVRIVAIVDELMGLCDRLESQLGTAEIDGRRFLDAILGEALTSAL